MTRDELAGALRASGEAFVAAVETLPEAALAEGRYENGWTARQILAHVAAIEWTYPRLLEIAGQPPAPEGSEPPTRPAQGGIDSYNARQVEKRDGVPVADLIEEFRRNREATIAAVQGTDEELFARPIRSAGGREGPLWRVIHDVAVLHVQGHGRDIVGAG